MRTVLAIALALPLPAAAGTLYSVRLADDVLVTIDTNTLQLTDIGPLGIDFATGGLAYDACDDELFANSLVGSTLGVHLVDRTTGAATVLPGSQTSMYALGIHADNRRLYGLSGTAIRELSQTTGAILTVEIGVPGGLDGLTWAPSYRSLLAYNGNTNELHLVEPDATYTTIGTTSVPLGDSGFTWDADTGRYWAITQGGDLYSFADDGLFDAVLEATGLGAHDGLTALDAPGVCVNLTTSCPVAGPGSIDITGATPNGRVVVLGSPTPGTTSLPLGPCAGEITGLSSLRVVDFVTADPQGVAVVTGPHLQTDCGTHVQALDVATCTLSNKPIAGSP